MLAVLLVVILPLSSRCLPAQPGREISDLRLRGAGAGDLLGLWRHSQPGAGRVLRPRRLLHGDVSQARSLQRREHQDPVDPRHSRFHGLESDHLAAACSGSRSTVSPSPSSPSSWCRPFRPDHRRRDVQAPRRRHLFRHHHAGGRGDPHHPDRRPAGLHRRHQRHDRPAHPEGLGHPARSRQDRALLLRSGAACSAASSSRSSSADSKLGRILVAMREKEDRVRFSGYSVANFKIFAFCIAAIFAAIGGAMFALQVGFMSPSFVGIVPSIEMVIYTAVGGRLSILGAVYGTLLVNFAKTSLSESLPATLAVRPRRTVHRRGARLPERPGRHLGGLRAAAHRPADRVAQAEIRATAGPTIPSPTARRRSEEIDHAHRSSAQGFPARGRGAHGFLRRLQGGQRSVLLCRGERDPRHHRPQRRRQDHGARPDLRQDQGHVGLDPVSRQGADEAEGEPDRAGRRRAQVPDAVDLRRPHRVRESRDFLSARPHRVRRADLHARRRRARPRRGSRRDDLPEGPPRHERRRCSATARSNGSRSACC